MDIKIGVFEVADYGGVVFFRLNPLQSEKNPIFIIFGQKMEFFKKVIWVSKQGFLMVLNTVVQFIFSLNSSKVVKNNFFKKLIIFEKKKLILILKWASKQGFSMSLNTMVGFILSKTLPKCKKCPFSPFLRKKIIFQKK